jgi:hypothetical protein
MTQLVLVAGGTELRAWPSPALRCYRPLAAFPLPGEPDSLQVREGVTDRAARREIGPRRRLSKAEERESRNTLNGRVCRGSGHVWAIEPTVAARLIEAPRRPRGAAFI